MAVEDTRETCFSCDKPRGGTAAAAAAPAQSAQVPGAPAAGTRFPALRRLADTIRLLAALELLGGLVAAVYVLVSAVGSGSPGQGVVVALGVAFVAGLQFVLILAWAELIEVAIAIEENTRSTAQALASR